MSFFQPWMLYAVVMLAAFALAIWLNVHGNTYGRYANIAPVLIGISCGYMRDCIVLALLAVILALAEPFVSKLNFRNIKNGPQLAVLVTLAGTVALGILEFVPVLFFGIVYTFQFIMVSPPRWHREKRR